MPVLHDVMESPGNEKLAVPSGEAEMSGISKRYESPEAILLDNRNERPLMIALATIVSVWSLASALTFASADLSAHWRHAPESPAAMSVLGR